MLLLLLLWFSLVISLLLTHCIIPANFCLCFVIRSWSLLSSIYCCNSSDLNLNSCHRNSAALCTFFTRNTVVADWFSRVLLVFDNSSSNRALVSLNFPYFFCLISHAFLIGWLFSLNFGSSVELRMSAIWFHSLPHFNDPCLCLMRCVIWYHLCNLKNVKNTHGGMLLTKSYASSWVFFTFFRM